MKSFRQYLILHEISSGIAARLSGAWKKQGNLDKAVKAMRGAKKRQSTELKVNGSDFFRPNQEDVDASRKMIKTQFGLGLKSGRVTSKNTRNPSWRDMKDRPDRILTTIHGTVY